MILYITVILTFLNLSLSESEKELIEKAEQSLDKGIEFFYSLNTNGGYVYFYSLDDSVRWGEEIADKNTIEVQPPGTPAVGSSFLKAYEATGTEKYLHYAKEAAYALVEGQNKFGGWDHTIVFGKENKNPAVSFDDNQTQSAVRFLMALDQEIEDDRISKSVKNALDLMLESQFDNGAWPHYYPEQGNYHDLATFNDATINNNIDVMIDAYRYYGDEEYQQSIIKAGNYIIASQVDTPQGGWAQQYDENLNPAWARTFEPPSVNSLVTVFNINSLIKIYLVTGEQKFLEPIPAAFKWLESVKLENGKHPRFVELNTNKPLYYDRGRKRVNSLEELSRERKLVYAYQLNLDAELDTIKIRLDNLDKYGREENLTRLYNDEELFPLRYSQLGNHLTLEKEVRQIIAAQDSLGRWIQFKDKYRDKKPNQIWSGEYAYKDRISSAVFVYNINTLSKYLSLKRNSPDIN